MQAYWLQQRVCSKPTLPLAVKSTSLPHAQKLKMFWSDENTWFQALVPQTQSCFLPKSNTTRFVDPSCGWNWQQLKTTPLSHTRPQLVDEVSWFTCLESVHVVGTWKYKEKKDAPEFTSERDKRTNMLVNSCLRDSDKTIVGHYYSWQQFKR